MLRDAVRIAVIASVHPGSELLHPPARAAEELAEAPAAPPAKSPQAQTLLVHPPARAAPKPLQAFVDVPPAPPAQPPQAQSASHAPARASPAAGPKEDLITALATAWRLSSQRKMQGPPKPVPGADGWKCHWVKRATGGGGPVGDNYLVTPQCNKLASIAAVRRWLESVGGAQPLRVEKDGNRKRKEAGSTHPEPNASATDKLPYLEHDAGISVEAFARGDVVWAHYGSSDAERWWKGKVSKVRHDGTLDILYDDGDKETCKDPSRVKHVERRSRPPPRIRVSEHHQAEIPNYMPHLPVWSDR